MRWSADIEEQFIACEKHATEAMVEITEDEVWELTPGIDDIAALVTPEDACDAGHLTRSQVLCDIAENYGVPMDVARRLMADAMKALSIPRSQNIFSHAEQYAIETLAGNIE